MIVPDFWAEARRQQRVGRRQVTVRRYGWSQQSQQEAQAMAEGRADEALLRILAGEKLSRYEVRTAYNGAVGVPIREEVVSRHGDEVITRNSYGARCLNTPRALFADIDFATPPQGGMALRIFLTLVLAAFAYGTMTGGWQYVIFTILLASLISWPLAGRLAKMRQAAQGGPERIVRERIQRFLKTHPRWNLRVYRTPAGMRLLATHRAFEAGEPEVSDFFSAIGADPVYALMCSNQRCFRARLSAKPWRAGVGDHLRPRPGVWPVAADKLAQRAAWVLRYEQAVTGFAACRFVESLGSGRVDEELRAVIELHDRESRALTDLPLA